MLANIGAVGGCLVVDVDEMFETHGLCYLEGTSGSYDPTQREGPDLLTLSIQMILMGPTPVMANRVFLSKV